MCHCSPSIIAASTWLCDENEIAEVDEMLTHEGYVRRKRLHDAVLYQKI